MKRFASLWATFFYLGKCPVAPGTAASLPAAVLWALFFLKVPVWWLQIPTFFASAALALWVSEGHLFVLHQHGKTDKDPREIVIDEVVGMGAALLFLPLTLQTVALTFAFFRLFDIIKPKPVRYWESLPGAWGILLDDVAAGVLANLCVRLILFWMS